MVVSNCKGNRTCIAGYSKPHHSSPSLEKCDAGAKGRGTGGAFTRQFKPPLEKQAIFVQENPGLCAFL